MNGKIILGKIGKVTLLFFCLLFCLFFYMAENVIFIQAAERETEMAGKEEYPTAEGREDLEVSLKKQLSEKTLCREDAAVCIYEYLTAVEEAFPERKIEKIKKYQRIKDIGQADPEKKDALVRVYALGIFTGESCGAYTHQRKLFPKKLLSEEEKKALLERTIKKEKRTAISYDGQVIRTANLPKNAHFFPYILESFPNAYYEDPFEMYYDLNRDMHKAGEDYFYPVQILKKEFLDKIDIYGLGEAHEKYSCDWISRVEKNLNLRLNFDYRKVDEAWMNDLLSTYAATMGYKEVGRKERKRMEEYVKTAKKTHVVLQGKASADISSLYVSGGYKIRVHVKFRILNADNLSPEKYDYNDVIYGKYMGFHNLKKGEWEENFYDIIIGSYNAEDYWGNFGVVDDSLMRFARPKRVNR